jgi:hypothetical protein
VSPVIKFEGAKKAQFTLSQAIPPTKGGLYSISKVAFFSGKFKLYFIVSQRLTAVRYNIHVTLFYEFTEPEPRTATDRTPTQQRYDPVEQLADTAGSKTFRPAQIG